tara:strand:- start:73 stop:339 length:267 start_codon:yes stop_codon:yes gene_type:complete
MIIKKIFLSLGLINSFISFANTSFASTSFANLNFGNHTIPYSERMNYISSISKLHQLLENEEYLDQIPSNIKQLVNLKELVLNCNVSV